MQPQQRSEAGVESRDTRQQGHGSILRRAASIIIAAALAAACADDTRAPFNQTVAGPTLRREAPVEPQFSRAVDPALLTLHSPARLASTPSGRLLVSDYYRGAVLVVDPQTLEPEAALEVKGRVLAVGLWGGRTFVGNATTRTVEVYGANGRLRYSFGGGAGAVSDPSDLAMDGDLGLVFVVDGQAKLVKVFDVDGNLVRTIAGFNNPTGIAVDPTRKEVFVSDFGNLSGFSANAAIKVLDYDGRVLREIPGRSTGFSRPQGLAVDSSRVYLVDAFRGEVLVLDRATGQKTGTLGGFGSGPGQLMLPLDVMIGKRGDVFVSSNQTARIERFTAGTVP